MSIELISLADEEEARELMIRSIIYNPYLDHFYKIDMCLEKFSNHKFSYEHTYGKYSRLYYFPSNTIYNMKRIILTPYSQLYKH